MKKIIQENQIDEDEARVFLNDFYHGIDLLPSVPEVLTREQAASVLSISLPTIDRMLKDKSIQLTKKSLLDYVMKNMIVNRPVILDEENEMNTPGIPMTDEEKDEWQKSFSDIEESINELYANTKTEDTSGFLFSEEDLKQDPKC